jgi:aminoglycoside 3-N-acetyltransferase I
LSASFTVRALGPESVADVRRLNALFADVFNDSTSYASAPPNDVYLNNLLNRDQIIALVAETEDELAGGLVAYVLPKFEQERSEVYIYDLAVVEHHRRRGVATALIEELQRIAANIRAWVIYVQADYGDEPAIALYEKLGTREDVMHFDIAPAIIK